MPDKPDERGPSETPGEEPPVPPSSADEGFGDAFLEATKVDGSGSVPPEPESIPVPPSTPPSQQQPGESDEDYKHRWETLQGIHRHDKEAWETEKAQLQAQLEAAKQLPSPPPAPEVRTPESEGLTMDHLLTPEEKQQIAEYDQDFDTVSKMEGLKRNKAFSVLEKKLKDLQDSIETRISSVTKQVTDTIAPIAKDIEERTLEDHFSSIRGTHPDFETYRDDGSIKSWIEKKPKYMRDALVKTYSSGQAEDVIDLISDFKRESNILTSTPQENVVDLSSRREQKRAALQFVSTRRGPVASGTHVATDFDSAFDEAIRKQ